MREKWKWGTERMEEGEEVKRKREEGRCGRFREKKKIKKRRREGS